MGFYIFIWHFLQIVSFGKETIYMKYRSLISGENTKKSISQCTQFLRNLDNFA